MPGTSLGKSSTRKFGFLVPLVIDRNHEIVCGHTRYKAAQFLGIKEVPCVIADELTEDQIQAFRLADNKVGEMAQWDMDLLPLELQRIMLPMTDFGFHAISDEDFADNFTLDAGEKKPFQQISITVHDEQARLVAGGDQVRLRTAGGARNLRKRESQQKWAIRGGKRMGRAKEIVMKVLPSGIANAFV